MLRFLCTLALLVAVSRAASPKKTVELFGNHDLAAWELVTLPALSSPNGPATPADLASVCKFTADGSLAVAGKPVSYLATKVAYENYRLHVEWRWPANAAKNSNSGVLLNIAGGPTNGTAWPACLQMQLKLGRAGDLLPMNGAMFAEKLSTPPEAKTPQLDRRGDGNEKPLGEWNNCDILCRGGTIEVTVNGVAQNKVTGCTPSVGRIGLQLEGTPFELRNVRLDPLP